MLAHRCRESMVGTGRSILPAIFDPIIDCGFLNRARSQGFDDRIMTVADRDQGCGRIAARQRLSAQL